MDKADVLRDVAKKVLNDIGQTAIDEMIDDERLNAAEAYVLGGIDSCFNKGVITFNEAATYYETLGVDPERASHLRQHHSRDKVSFS